MMEYDAAITYNTVTKRLTAPSATRPSALRVSLATILTQVTGTLFGALTAIDTEAASRETVLVTAQAMLRAIRLPTVRQSLGTTALTFDIPAEWRGRFFHDRATNDLCFLGWMTQAERDALKALADVPGVRLFGPATPSSHDPALQLLPAQSMASSSPFCTPSVQVGAWQVGTIPPPQTPLMQSVSAPQASPSAHFRHSKPPQSTSLSVPFLTASLQMAT